MSGSSLRALLEPGGEIDRPSSPFRSTTPLTCTFVMWGVSWREHPVAPADLQEPGVRKSRWSEPATVKYVAVERDGANLGMDERLPARPSGGTAGPTCGVEDGDRVKVVPPLRDLVVLDGDDGDKAVVVGPARLRRLAVHLVLEDGH